MEQPSYSIVATAVEEGKCVPEEYQATIPEARDIVWDDDFFDDDDGIVAVFDYDYDQMLVYERFVMASALGMLVILYAFYAAIFLGVYGAIGMVALMLLFSCPCLLHQQAQWYVHAHHVAITRDGIRFVIDRRKSCWGLPMCDRSKYSRTIPFDQITECDILEPAGSACFGVKRELYVVNVPTASSSSGSNNNNGVGHKLSISGLKEPYKFQALVLAMKRVYSHEIATSPAALPLPIATAFPLAQLETELELVNQSTTNSCSQSSSDRTTSVTALLNSIREELRENNELLRQMNNSSNDTTQELHLQTGDML